MANLNLAALMDGASGIRINASMERPEHVALTRCRPAERRGPQYAGWGCNGSQRRKELCRLYKLHRHINSASAPYFGGEPEPKPIESKYYDLQIHYQGIKEQDLLLPVANTTEKCAGDKRKILNREDTLFTFLVLGFDNYAEALKIYLARYRGYRTTTLTICRAEQHLHPSSTIPPPPVVGNVLDGSGTARHTGWEQVIYKVHNLQR
ncbi:hypothetical protein TEQG_08080 [Trichophyton equinum CBS 127.97]|uniref:Uncharacterized protein n=1 Tax=Trichophyton equinum (strain ATCC MYA-4606 / CBS 127.97) TaxID=559882 RepID=F2Q4I4_TRIEC|nr:hypothetical protein TEQG_08080 [Trichophyton equinum CBS 127.97]